jgi:serine-type D-Ala-D-Ala carboxypeptidase (penicillin-binding protein 5/6)
MKYSLILLAMVALGALVGTYVLFQRHSRSIAPPADLMAAAEQPATTDGQPPTAIHTAPASAARTVVTEGAGSSGTSAPGGFVAPPDVRQFTHLTMAMPADLQTRAAACESGLMLDVTNQQMMWTKKPDEVLPIASITKLMTIYVALDAIAGNDQLTLDSPATVSRQAAQQGGSQLWLEAGASYPMRSLMQAMMIKSANDAAYVVGESMAGGDMDVFVAAMNRRARLMGLRSARFHNPNGMPGPDSNSDNRATSYDLAMLALACKRFPVIWEWASMPTARFVHTNGEPIDMANTNRLVRGSYPGVTGLKTGFIDRSGFCMIATANRDGRELMIVALGFKQRQDRDDFVKGLLEWGFQQRPR